MSGDKEKLYSFKSDDLLGFLDESKLMFDRSKILLVEDEVKTEYFYHLLTEVNTINYKLYMLSGKIIDFNEEDVDEYIVKAEEMAILQSIMLQRYYTMEELAQSNISLITH